MPNREKNRKIRFIAMICLATPAFTAAVASPPTGLNDTGLQQCWNGSAMEPCTEANSGDTSAFPGQDGRFGHDAAATAGGLAKIGGGAAGFDFTKLDVHGNPLADQGQAWIGFDGGSEAAGTAWSCVRDNVTGLIWEVKTDMADPDLRDRDWRYSWYNDTLGENGGHPGYVGGDSCGGTLSGHPDECNTQYYAAAVNAVGICGETDDDWRPPTHDELVSIFHFGAAGPPYIDSGYFPNTVADPAVNGTFVAYWTSTPYAVLNQYAWLLKFFDGWDSWTHKGQRHNVRLVRGGE